MKDETELSKDPKPDKDLVSLESLCHFSQTIDSKPKESIFNKYKPVLNNMVSLKEHFRNSKISFNLGSSSFV